MGEIGFRKEILPSGIVVVGEVVDHVRSFSVGVWLRSGARDEDNKNAGISHFIEHMLFRGTERRSAAEIAKSMESIGGHLDAFTERECTCYFARAMDEHLDVAVDVLSDILCHSVFEPEQIDREKRVIAEEIKNLEDTPDELIHDIVASVVWKDHPLGASILGRPDTISGFNEKRVREGFCNRYVPSNVVVSAAGHFDFGKLVELVDSSFDLPDGPGFRRGDDIPNYSRRVAVQERALSQQYLCLCGRGLGYEDPSRYDLRLLNTVLGEGMSSRLFQRVRDQAGLAYAVYSYVESYRKTGLSCIFMGVSPDKGASCLEMVHDELAKLAAEGISQEELDSAKAQLKGGLMLSLESMSARMNRAARGEIYYGRELELDEIIKKIDACTRDSVAEIAKRIGLNRNDLSLVSLGPASAKDLKA